MVPKQRLFFCICTLNYQLRGYPTSDRNSASDSFLHPHWNFDGLILYMYCEGSNSQPLASIPQPPHHPLSLTFFHPTSSMFLHLGWLEVDINEHPHLKNSLIYRRHKAVKILCINHHLLKKENSLMKFESNKHPQAQS